MLNPRLLLLTAILLASAALQGETFVTLNAGTFQTEDRVSANTLRFLNPISGSCSSAVNGLCADSNFVYDISSGSGHLDIYDKNPGQNYSGLILQATFASNNWGGAHWTGSIGGPGTGTNATANFDVMAGQLHQETGRPIGSSQTSALTNVYNNGYAAYLYLDMSDMVTPSPSSQNLVPYGNGSGYFPGVSGPPSNVQLNSGEAVRLPVTFTSLPSNVIFNVYGVTACSTNPNVLCADLIGTNPNSSTSGFTGCCGPPPPPGVPEPATLLLFGGGLALMSLRRRLS